MKYVHGECILQWIKTRTHRAKNTCELCKEPYAIDYNYPLEKDILGTNINTYLFIGPSWHIASNCIITILLNRLPVPCTTETLYFIAHLVYQVAYLAMFYAYIRCTIHRQSLYYTLLIHSSSPLLLFIHSILLTILAALYIEEHTFSFILLGIFNHCYLCLYPMLHIIILNKLNEQRTLVITNRQP